jgi:hypothetical protein
MLQAAQADFDVVTTKVAVVDAEGNLITEAEPGTFGVLPAGWDFTTYDPAYPNDAMAGFIKGMLRAFSSGVGLTYNTIGNDLEGVSLSSLRHVRRRHQEVGRAAGAVTRVGCRCGQWNGEEGEVTLV